MKITINTLQAGILSLCLAAITSCSKDAQTPGSPSSPGLAKKIQKKWIIGGNKSVQADANISSLEFNNSNQAIVIQNTADNQNIISSHYYSVKDEKTVEIKNFGTLIVDSITDNTGKFTFTPTGSTTPKVLQATASTFSVGSSPLTNQLCRPWKLDFILEKYYEKNDSGNFVLSSSDTIMGEEGDILTVTSSGTYFIGDDPEPGYWKWKANGSNIICVSDTSTFYCYDFNQFTVNFIGSKVTFTNTVADTNFKFEIYQECSPYTFTGGRTAVSSGSRSINPKFFQRKRPLTR